MPRQPWVAWLASALQLAVPPPPVVVLAAAGQSEALDVCTATSGTNGGCAAAVDLGWATGVTSSPTVRPCSELFQQWQVEAVPKKLWTRSEPAVILGVAAAGKWDLEAFGRVRFRSAYGSARVKAFGPAQAAIFSGQTSRVHSVRSVLSKLHESKQRLYVFDKGFFAGDGRTLGVQIPTHLFKSGFEKILTLGGPFAGTQFHVHGAAFLNLLAGRKLWYLHRPGFLPNASARALHQDISMWEANVLPTLHEQAPIGCIQNAGETLFVPDGWAHATSNLDETIGVAWQATSSMINSCKLGEDFICVLNSFSTAERLAPAKQVELYPILFSRAEDVLKITTDSISNSSFPAATFLRHLTPYWRVASSEAKAIYKRYRTHAIQALKSAPRRSDEAVLAAAMIKVLVDVVFKAANDVRQASQLLQPAVKKVPEAGYGIALARLLAPQGQWQKVVEQLELHLVHFPDDPEAHAMISQARAKAQR